MDKGLTFTLDEVAVSPNFGSKLAMLEKFVMGFWILHICNEPMNDSSIIPN